MLSPLFQKNLKKCIMGYQSVMQGPNVPIKESVWEFVLAQAAAKTNMKCVWTPGSHAPGADITVDDITYSCKTSRVEPKQKVVMISSYRLTNVCKKQNCTSADIINELDDVRGNFDFYALLVRQSEKNKQDSNREYIKNYKVYNIPASDIKACTLAWSRDSRGNWKGEGGEYSMTITKTMSYQLWIKVSLSWILKYECLNIDIGDAVRPMNLADIYDTLYAEPPSASTDDAETLLSKQLASLSLQSAT